ncbi:MAG: hypothetical protein WCB53_11665 [Terriglobales bacterium]
MYSLRSVNVMSCAKMMGAIYGGLFLVVSPFLLLGGFAGILFGRTSPDSPGALLILLAILAPFFYGAVGFVMGAFTAWIYNLVARQIGGIRLELKTVVPNSPSNLGLI